MTTKTAPKENKIEAAGRTLPCHHYWVIEAPQGRSSNGECLLCGEVRQFPNYLSDCLIDNDREKFDEWVSRQYRKKTKGNDYPGLSPEIE